MQEITEALQAMKFGGVTIYPLLLLAVLALVIIIDKFYLYWRYIRLPRSLFSLIETYDFSWEKLDQELKAYPRKLLREVFPHRYRITSINRSGGWNRAPAMRRN